MPRVSTRLMEVVKLAATTDSLRWLAAYDRRSPQAASAEKVGADPIGPHEQVLGAPKANHYGLQSFIAIRSIAVRCDPGKEYLRT